MKRWQDFIAASTSSRRKVRAKKSTVKTKPKPKQKPKKVQHRKKVKLTPWVTINVGGRIYKVKRQLLMRRKNTLLEMVAKGKDDIPCSYQDEDGVYFFDRQPDVFHSILKFYETGELHSPTNICSQIVKQELRFWNIRDIRLEPCCWESYSSRLTDMKDLRRIEAKCSILDSNYDFLVPLIHGKAKLFNWKLHSIFEVMGAKSQLQMGYNGVFITITLLNFVLSCSMSTLPSRYAQIHATSLYNNRNVTIQETLVMTQPMTMHIGIELLFTVFFVTDQILRLLASNDIKRFFRPLLNLNDFVCNLVSLIVLLVWFTFSHLPLWLENISHIFRAMRTLRLLRHSRGLMLIAYTIETHLMDIGFMLVIFVVLITLFGSAIFISEISGGDLRTTSFVNLPMGLFWAGTTLTSVGYGNMAPTCTLSYIIAMITCVSGMYIIFLPIPLLARQLCLYFVIVKKKLDDIPQFGSTSRRKNLKNR